MLENPLTLTLPHSIKLAHRNAGCAPTDSLRLVSIYIFCFPLARPGFGKQLNITGWPAVALAPKLLAISLAPFFSPAHRLAAPRAYLQRESGCWFTSWNFPLIGNVYVPGWLLYVVSLAPISSRTRRGLLFFSYSKDTSRCGSSRNVPWCWHASLSDIKSRADKQNRRKNRTFWWTPATFQYQSHQEF